MKLKLTPPRAASSSTNASISTTPQQPLYNPRHPKSGPPHPCPSHRLPHMLSLPKRLCLVPHGNTISTSRQFPALESTNAPNSDRFSTRPFRTSQTGLNSTPAIKTACRQVRGRKTGTPRCLDVKSGSRQAEAARQRGCVLFKLFEASQPCRTTTAFLCSISNFCVPKARRQRPVSLQLPRRQSWEEAKFGGSATVTQWHSLTIQWDVYTQSADFHWPGISLLVAASGCGWCRAPGYSPASPPRTTNFARLVCCPIHEQPNIVPSRLQMALRRCSIPACRNPADRYIGSCMMCAKHLCSYHLQSVAHTCPSYVCRRMTEESLDHRTKPKTNPPPRIPQARDPEAYYPA